MDFELNDIKILLSLGYEVHVATNFHGYEDRHMDGKLEQLGVQKSHQHEIHFARSPVNTDNLKAYKELKKVIFQQRFSLIHCHTPVGGVLARLAAKRYNEAVSLHNTRVEKGKSETNGRAPDRVEQVKVIYTAHGFHFYKGAPLKNWLLYYLVESLLSHYTDVLITINKEDYGRAKKKLHAKKTVYVPGVGVDIAKFAPRQSGRDKIRAELGLEDTDIMLLSVGELNANKNHASVIKALAGMRAEPGTDLQMDANTESHANTITYVIVGEGDKKAELKAQAVNTGVDLRLPGYRNDVSDFYDAADAYILPSIREGLNVSLMEAMASGLPAACGKIRGNTDLVNEEECLFEPTDTTQIKKAVAYVLDNREKLRIQNLEKIRAFDLTTVEELVSGIYAGGHTSI